MYEFLSNKSTKGDDIRASCVFPNLFNPVAYRKDPYEDELIERIHKRLAHVTIAGADFVINKTPYNLNEYLGLIKNKADEFELLAEQELESTYKPFPKFYKHFPDHQFSLLGTSATAATIPLNGKF